jgi:hypothetical protein
VRAYVAGRYAAVRDDRVLRVFDLRTGRRRGEAIRAPGFTVVRLVSTGLAVAIGGDGSVQDSAGGYHRRASDPYFLAVRGMTIATRGGGRIWLDGLEDVSAPDGTLVRQEGVRVRTVRGRLRAGGMDLGSPLGSCVSPSACLGIGALTIAGRFLATLHTDGTYNSEPAFLRVYDLKAKRAHMACYGGVIAWVLSPSGRSACMESLESGTRLISDGVQLDHGPGLDPQSLRLQGDRITWVKDGVTESA